MVTDQKQLKMKKIKKKPAFNKKNFIINLLRRGTFRFPPRSEAIKNARVDRGLYKCAQCENLFGPKEIKVDHIQPVVSTSDGFIDWNTYIDRMFPDDSNKFAILCSGCHDSKSAVEREIRKKYRLIKKKPV